MDKCKLAEIILKILKEDDDNNTQEFFSKIDQVEVTDLMLAETINYLIDIKMITGSKQSIGMKDEVSFSSGLSITPKGISYLKNNSSASKIYRALKEVREWLPL